MRSARFTGSVLVAVFGLTACADTVVEPTDVGVMSSEVMSASVADGAIIDRASALLPDGHLSDQDLLEICSRAINGEDYVCPPSTAVIDWYLDAFYSALAAEETNTLNLYNLAADLVVTYDALLYMGHDTAHQFGYNGEYTEVLRETERDIKRFWDIHSSNIAMVPLHGSMLLDVNRTARVYRTVFGIPAATASVYASIVRSSVVNSIVFNGGNHPFFSFNAFAFSSGTFGDKIAMGDGMMAGYTAMGFSDVAPQAVFAHEFGHHIQYENQYFNDPIVAGLGEPEQTRYTELMADAYSAYYLTHKRGRAMNKHRVAEFLQAFFEIGDCGFSSDGHHGTPAQRMRAAQFGFDIADQARKQGHIMSSDAFHDLFVAQYPTLIAPDAI